MKNDRPWTQKPSQEIPDHVWNAIITLAFSEFKGEISYRLRGSGLLGHFLGKKYVFTFKDGKVFVK